MQTLVEIYAADFGLFSRVKSATKNYFFAADMFQLMHCCPSIICCTSFKPNCFNNNCARINNSNIFPNKLADDNRDFQICAEQYYLLTWHFTAIFTHELDTDITKNETAPRKLGKNTTILWNMLGRYSISRITTVNIIKSITDNLVVVATRKQTNKQESLKGIQHETIWNCPRNSRLSQSTVDIQTRIAIAFMADFS